MNFSALLPPAFGSFLIALLLSSSTASAQVPTKESLVKWTDLATAQAAAKKDGKPLMIDVYTSWCGPCRMLDANTFGDKQTAGAASQFIKVRRRGQDGIYNGKSYSNPSSDRRVKGAQHP